MTFTLLEEVLLLLLFVSFVCSVCLFFTIVKTGSVHIFSVMLFTALTGVYFRY